MSLIDMENTLLNDILNSLEKLTIEQRVKILNKIYSIQDIKNDQGYPLYCDKCKKVKTIDSPIDKFCYAFTCKICSMSYCRECEDDNSYLYPKVSCTSCRDTWCGNCNENRDIPAINVMDFCKECDAIFCEKCVDKKMANKKRCFECEDERIKNIIERDIDHDRKIKVICSICDKREKINCKKGTVFDYKTCGDCHKYVCSGCKPKSKRKNFFCSKCLEKNIAHECTPKKTMKTIGK